MTSAAQNRLCLSSLLMAERSGASVSEDELCEKCIIKQLLKFGFRMISWIIKTSCLCYLPKPKAEADNTNLGFDNSWYHAQPHPVIVYCWIPWVLFLTYCFPSRHKMFISNIYFKKTITEYSSINFKRNDKESWSLKLIKLSWREFILPK